MKSFNKLACVLFVAVAQGISAIAGEFLIHDGDRVVFLGDSITAVPEALYHLC